MEKVKMDDVINKILTSCKTELDTNEIYLSEDDFKFSFATASKEIGCKNVILEFPIKTLDLYKGNREARKDFERKAKSDQLRSSIDISFVYEGTRYFVELKYKVKRLNVVRHGASFVLSQQGAGNIGLYHFHEDIERMECIKATYPDARTFCILITNDPYYWNKHKEGTMVSKVDIHETTSPSIEDFKLGDTLYRDLQFRNIYPTWGDDSYQHLFKDFAGEDNGQFKVLVIETK